MLGTRKKRGEGRNSTRAKRARSAKALLRVHSPVTFSGPFHAGYFSSLQASRESKGPQEEINRIEKNELREIDPTLNTFAKNKLCRYMLIVTACFPLGNNIT